MHSAALMVRKDIARVKSLRAKLPAAFTKVLQCGIPVGYLKAAQCWRKPAKQRSFIPEFRFVVMKLLLFQCFGSQGLLKAEHAPMAVLRTRECALC